MKASPTPRDPYYARRIRESFARQTFMTTIGANLERIEPGLCAISIARRADLCQQRGFLHGGVTTAIADSAAGYAAFSLMPANASVVTVELKMNLMAPAIGERLLATARVLKAGRTLTVVSAEVTAEQDDRQATVAALLGTFICLENTPDAPVD